MVRNALAGAGHHRHHHDVTQPTLFLTVGLPGVGKTTAARRLDVEDSALRLNKDEWMKVLYWREDPVPASDVIEGRRIQIGLHALRLGVNVVIGYGLWSKDERSAPRYGLWSKDKRSALRQAAMDVDAASVVCSFDLPPEEQRRRLDRRLAEAPQDTWLISDEELDRWAGQFDVPTPAELGGSEPIGDPPATFTSWQDWRADRWPAALHARSEVRLSGPTLMRPATRLAATAPHRVAVA